MLQFKIILVCAACLMFGCVSGNSHNDVNAGDAADVSGVNDVSGGDVADTGTHDGTVAIDTVQIDVAADSDATWLDLPDLPEVVDPDVTADASDVDDAVEPTDVTNDAEVTIQWSCPSFGTPTIAGNLDGPKLTEASGLAASRQLLGVLWSHNDSGDSKHVYAIQTPIDGGLVDPGTTVYEYTFTDITLIDQEDIAIGPFDGIEGDAIFVADVGDNNYKDAAKKRNFVTVYVFAELAGIAAQNITNVVRVDVKYPDGAHDCEAFFVDPLTGDFYFVAKESDSDTSSVYRKAAPHVAVAGPAGDPVELMKVAEIQLVTVTGADMSADGLLLLIRGYYGGLYFQRKLTDSVEKMLVGKSCALPEFSSEPYYECQGEAIAFAPDNSGFYSVSEYRDACLQNINFTPLTPVP